MSSKRKLLNKIILIAVLALAVGLISYPKAVSKIPPVYNFLNKFQISLGLDLQGGIHLEYEADLRQVESSQIDDAMQAVQDVIERRVNAFGVAEPTIYTTKSGTERRLIVELAGVKDINEAKNLIKETPFLEFKEEGPEDESQKIPQEFLDKMNADAKIKAQDILKKALAGEDFAKLAEENSEDPGSKENGGEYDFFPKGSFVPEYEEVIFEKDLKDGEIYKELAETQFGWHIIKKIEIRGEGEEQEFKSAHILISKKTQPVSEEINWVPTGLTGKNLKDAYVDFQSQGISTPKVVLVFDDEGKKLFAEITKRNIGKRVAILLDGEIITAPTVNSEIPNGTAEVTGNYTIDEANNLVRKLKEGALPVPIILVSQQSIEASLGQISFEKSVKAGAIGLAVVIIFLLVYYRFLGFIASITLLLYTGIMIAFLKLNPLGITLTLPGIAGIIISIGMAVDANILIFERTKEEIRRGRTVLNAIEEGFKRAWTSIRDGNVSSIITAVILYAFSAGFVRGFAVTLLWGVIFSMLTAIVITRTLIRFMVGEWIEKRMWMIGVKVKK
ncbi:MAG TPA: protein translocase subunit SecD [Candidatus Moranbacteria bacterium]|nr:protein translocase subunit SecD [Candidatus Moranbacteria bacterium]